MSKAVLFLEDGFYQEGNLLGAPGETMGEVVFNTSMSGYQEIITDPSYKGQIVCMTYPLIGNYGVNSKDMESGKIQTEGFIIKERSKIVSNWQAEESLEDYLKKYDIVGIDGIDTRAVTKHLRVKGSMRGIISSKEFNKEKLKSKLQGCPPIEGRDLVKEVIGDNNQWEPSSGNKPLEEDRKHRVVVIDCGVKRSILNNLSQHFKDVVLVPGKSSLKDVLDLNPDGILFSNGPGDPAGVPYVVDLAKSILQEVKSGSIKASIMGICLGHQILGLAMGGNSYKLKFGHHGGNHPVKDLKTDKIDITAQNHNFCVDIDSLPEELETTHINLYDKTPEGMQHKELPLFSVQFHPEAGPGPFDAHYIFGKFKKMVGEYK